MGQLSLKRKTLTAMLWSFAEFISKQGIQLIIQVILARLLLPEHFGLIGMVTIFIAISNSLVNSGLDQALIREKKPSQQDYSTVFYFNLAISGLIYLLIFIAAPLISNFYNEPMIMPIIRVLMLSVIFNAFGTIQRVILIREINFKAQTRITIISSVISGVIAVILAFIGLGVWSLVIQMILSQFLQMLLLFGTIKWFPSLTFDLKSFKYYFTFGYRLLLSGLLETFYRNIYYVIIGRFYPANQLGYYTNAKKVRDISSQSITQAIQKVTYPVLSQMRNEPYRLENNYKKIMKVSAYVIFPFMLGIAAIAPNLVPMLLGERWIPSVVYLQLLCLSGILYPIHALNLNILKVKGRSDLFLKLEIIKKIFHTVFIVFALIFTRSIEGLILTSILNSYNSLLINMYYSAREINYKISRQLLDLAPTFLIAIFMSLTVYYIGILMALPTFILIIIQISMGIIIYIVLSIIFKRPEFKYLNSLIKDFLRI